MKHIQKDYKVKTYMPQESANQNVAIVGERDDEYQAVPSVMKLTCEEVDEMIPETRRRISSSDRRQNRGSCHRTPREQIPQRAIEQIVNMSRHTHTKWWRTSSKILSPAASCEHTGCEDCLKARPVSEPVNKS